MKVEMHVTVNIGNYQSFKLGVVEANDFEECKSTLLKEFEVLGIPLDGSSSRPIEVTIEEIFKRGEEKSKTEV